MVALRQLVIDALSPYGLRKETETEWRCNSPLRPGANSHSFKVHFDDDENGAYFDHRSEEGGTLTELAQALGIQVERKQPTVTKRNYATIDDYAAAHHIPAAVLLKNGWSDTEMVYDGAPEHRKERPALMFKTGTGKRWRFIDGKKSYYKSEVGYKACWYGLKRALAMASESNTAVVICNGEVSTLAAQHRGVAACAVTGGEKELPQHLAADLLSRWTGKVILAYDCDETGRQAAMKVRMQLARLNPIVVDLGFSDGGDLADFAALYEDRSVDELERRAESQKVAIPEKQNDDIGELATVLRDLKRAVEGDGDDLQTLTAQARGQLDRIEAKTDKPVTLSFTEIARENMLLIDERIANPNPINGLRCNIPALDRAIGGFAPEMYVIYGATSMGKSSLSVSFAREFLTQAPGFIATTESDPRRWMMKLAASICQIPSDKLETGQLSKQEYERVKEAFHHLSDMGCHMLKHGSPSVPLLRGVLLEGKEKYGYEWVMVDSGSKMRAPGMIYERTASVANDLQTLWQEVNLPFIVTTQVGRDVSERGVGKKMPLLEDGYGGGVIEQNAGVVLGLYNHQYYVELGTEPANEALFPEGTALVRILKNRWRGDARTSAVQLKFVGGSGFYEYNTTPISELVEQGLVR